MKQHLQIKQKILLIILFMSNVWDSFRTLMFELQNSVYAVIPQRTKTVQSPLLQDMVKQGQVDLIYSMKQFFSLLSNKKDTLCLGFKQITNFMSFRILKQAQPVFLPCIMGEPLIPLRIASLPSSAGSVYMTYPLRNVHLFLCYHREIVTKPKKMTIIGIL